MTITNLKQMRHIVPGTLIVLAAFPIYLHYDLLKFDWLSVLQIAPAAILGMIYNLFESRTKFNQPSHARVQANIKSRLLEAGRTLPISATRRTELLTTSRELMSVFYSLVDSNPSLTVKSELVMDNGLIWTSIADVTVIGLAAVPLNLVFFLITGAPIFYWAVVTGFVVALFAGEVLHPIAERRHIRLSNEQLDFIVTQCIVDLTQKVDAL